jgi:hypothetical protein
LNLRFPLDAREQLQAIAITEPSLRKRFALTLPMDHCSLLVA